MAGNRSARLDGEFKRALSEVLLTDIKDPRISKMASISRVSVTPDLKYLKAMVSVYDTEENRNATIEGLNSAAGYIRTKLNNKIKVRRIPELTFVLDTSIEYGVRMAKLIDEVTEGLPEEDDETID